MGLEVDGVYTKDSSQQPPSPSKEAMEAEDRKEKAEFSIEEAFASSEVPPWWAQITVRGIVVSIFLGIVFSVITLKLSLTTGVIPSLNISAGLLGFFFVKLYTVVLAKLGIRHRPFTRQENTVIQTCVVACYGLAFSGGFGSYLTGMDSKTYKLANSPNDSLANVKDPMLGWIIAYLFVVGFLGLFAVVPLRKVMIIDYKLTYPSGTATAVLINSFHTPHGLKDAIKQIYCLGKYFAISFFFSFFKWFFSGVDDSCGFDSFPSLGFKAYANKFYFDFSLTYVGAGMICPHLINVSLLLGGILSWGLMWPLIGNKAGDWYPAGLGHSDLKGLYGYKVFIAIALILGDGLYNFVKITGLTLWSLRKNWKKNPGLLPAPNAGSVHAAISYDEERRNALFTKDQIPFKAAAACYVALAVVSMGVIPQLFAPVKWYYVLLSYCVAPILGFCNAYGCGLTDWSLASTYGKLGLFIFSAWAGADGGVLAGLASCGVMMIIVACSADLMQDFKTGYLTLSSPRSMFVSQLVGTLLGCIVAPSSFWLFWNAFDIGGESGEYRAPYALIYREMAIIGTQGFGALPKHCLELCYAFFALAIAVNFARDKPLARWAPYIPIPMAMAIPFYIGPYFAIDMFVGTAVVFAWQRVNHKESKLLVPAVASGLICGDGIWTMVSAVLALAKKNPPICMYFLPSSIVASLDIPPYR